MTKQDHINRHIKLHKCLDELLADFINHHPDMHGFSGKTISELLKWSNQQTINPIEDKK